MKTLKISSYSLSSGSENSGSESSGSENGEFHRGLPDKVTKQKNNRVQKSPEIKSSTGFEITVGFQIHNIESQEELGSSDTSQLPETQRLVMLQRLGKMLEFN